MRTFLLGGLILLAGAVLIGCGKSGSNAESDDEGPPAGEERFLSPEKHREVLASQSAMCPDTMKALRAAGVAADRELRLEYFFYSNGLENVAALAAELTAMGYSEQHGPSAGDEALFMVTGWTTKMPMDDQTVLAWVKQMCDLGSLADCEFDGWGTKVE